MPSKIATMHDVSECKTIDMVLDASGTNWEPKLYTPEYIAEGSSIADTDSRVIVNPSTGKALGYVGHRYKPNSHVGQLRMLDGLVSEGVLTPATVSVWDHGAIMAYQFRAPSLDMVIQGRDVVSPLLTLAFWHDGLGSDRGFFADFRWFCKNQMGQVSRLTTSQNVRHMGENVTKYGDLVEYRIRELKQDLGERYSAMRRMLQAPITTTGAMGYFANVLGTEDPAKVMGEVETLEYSKLRGDAGRVADLMTAMGKDDCNAPGTVWQAYNGVTRYLTHDIGRSAAARSARALLGDGGSMASKAFELARALTV